MRIPQKSFTRRAAVLAIGAALATIGCAARGSPDTDARAAAPSAAMSVACEPTRRAVVHPAVVNGIPMSQVECVTTGMAPAGGGAAGFQPVSYTPQPATAPASSAISRLSRITRRV